MKRQTSNSQRKTGNRREAESLIGVYLPCYSTMSILLTLLFPLSPFLPLWCCHWAIPPAGRFLYPKTHHPPPSPALPAPIVRKKRNAEQGLFAGCICSAQLFSFLGMIASGRRGRERWVRIEQSLLSPNAPSIFPPTHSSSMKTYFAESFSVPAVRGRQVGKLCSWYCHRSIWSIFIFVPELALESEGPKAETVYSMMLSLSDMVH